MRLWYIIYMIEIPKDIKTTLSEIGLDRAEIQVYMLLVQKNLLTIQQITTELSLPRSSVHLACENLLAKGVIKVTVSGKRRYFYLEQPKNIENFITHKENQLKSEKLAISSILPKLSAIHAVNSESESIEIEELQGEDGFVEVFYRSLNQPKDGEVLRFSGKPENFTIGRDRLVNYRKERTKKRIFAKILQPDSEYAAEEIKDAKLKMREVFILPRDIYDPNIQASVWADNVAFTVWDKGLHSVVIKNKSIAEFMKQLFGIASRQSDH